MKFEDETEERDFVWGEIKRWSERRQIHLARSGWSNRVVTAPTHKLS